ncbi:MAG: ATP-binding cassette domain-containing protein [Pelagimonas sp.]|jgi:putative ABC transport system ATP-binding protein|nr:ATP-binding cassette domain-containing protein [Pelagimonas sp.]
MGLSLEINNLLITSTGGRVLLDLPELTLSAGQSLGIRGASGAGKSTLLMALAGLAERATGRVFWGDNDLLSLSTRGKDRFRAKHIGMIFQDFLLFDELDILSNAALPALFAPRADRAAIRTHAAEHLTKLGLSGLDAQRNTRDSMQGQGLQTLSGGERQRVAVARALAQDAPILLADEPTASLDRRTADALIHDLSRVNRDQGKTLITVSHDPALLARMDRVITLDQGRIVPPSEEAPQ